MRRHPWLGRLLLAGALLVATRGPAAAQRLAQTESDPTAAAAPPTLTLGGYVEVGASYAALTAGEPDWRGGYLRGALDIGRRNTVLYEVTGAQRFDDEGVFFGLGLTHTIDPDWYATVSAGTSAGGFFFPRFRVDGFLNRKWLERRQLVTTLGLGYYDAKDVHHDWSFFLGGAYYFEAPWIVEGGLRVTLSNPGAVAGYQPFLAVTYGRYKAFYLTARAGGGNEAYQVVGPDTALVDFRSQTASLTWRHWLGRDWGFRASAEYYHNPTYQRVGIEFGLFRDF
jgi:YaiO family outer membrane protein